MKYKAGKQFAWFVPPNEQHPKGKFHRSSKPMLNDEMMAMATKHHWNHACYESVFQFPDWTGGRLTADIAKSAIIDCLYLDFDCKQDPLRAIRDAGAIADYVGHSTNWFSGMKGTGVIIHCEPANIIPDLKGAVLTRFALVLQDMFYGITTMDMAVTGDVNRVHRIIDTVHPGTGLHAIGLTGQELRTLSLEEILLMAQATRGLTQRPTPSKWVTEQLQLIEELIIKERMEKLAADHMIGRQNAYGLGCLLKTDQKREVWDFIVETEELSHRIQMKKIANLPPTSGGRTPEETWLLKVIEIFRVTGHMASIQPEGSNTSTSSSEHEARAHIVNLANDCGWVIQQIAEIFNNAHNYNQKITEGQVKSLLRR